ncbi:MAG: hypothetical protein IT294_06745 [Deltaproteobacteria bacterium]|nr:hypothetical protein [Deltaproteobacteria bacterium]
MTPPMECAEYGAWVMDVLARVADPLDPAALEHAAACAACRRGTEATKAGWDLFADVAPIAPPPALAARMRETVLRLIAEERAPATTSRRAASASASGRAATEAGWGATLQVPLAVTSAALVTAATLLLLSGLVFATALPRGHLFFCAAMYTGLLVGAFSWIYSATTVHGVHLDVAARVGILALAITLAASTACPELHVLAWWDRSAFGVFFTDHLGRGGSSLVFGFAYGLFPGFLAALFGGRLLAERPLANGLVAVAVVFLLATPVIYLQSAPFTSGVIAIWLAGTAVGTMCGVFGALRVRRRVRFAAA